MKIVKCDNITPNKVSEEVQRGREIVSTPHLGNFTTYGFAIKSLGVTPVFFDGNIPKKDNIAYPAHIIKNGESYEIAKDQDDITTPYLIATTKNIKCNGNGNGNGNGDKGHENYEDIDVLCQKVGHMHYIALLNVLGKVKITSDYFFVQNPYAYDILKILLKNEFSCFNRQLLPDGSVVKKDFIPISDQVKNLNKFFDVKKQHMRTIMCGLDIKESECYITSNEVNVFLMCMRSLINDIKNGLVDLSNAYIYTLSGVSMINYTQEKYMREALQKMYDILYKSEYVKLPRDFIVNMIPGACLKNMPTTDEQDKINIMNNIAENVIKYKENKKDIGSVSGEYRDTLIKQQNELKEFFMRLTRKLIDFKSKRVTQYDDNHDVIIPDKVKDITFKDIDRFFND